MKIPYNILIQIKMSVRPYFKGFTLIFFFYNCRKQEYIIAKKQSRSEWKIIPAAVEKRTGTLYNR